ncbi:hypothetical protein C8J56DRAFT_1044688 [Mycena floridula]|nr:hypothetical protein C8J56DRAFT_1044688 [Mycena floridula]
MTFTESSRIADIEKAGSVHHIAEKAVKHGSIAKTSRWIRFQLWFNTYRKFFTSILVMNIVAFILGVTGVWIYPQRYTGAFVLGNLFAAILVRNELFGRVLYLIVNALFAKWTPLTFRLACTSILQHLGGIHSACASSAFLWLVYRITLIFIHHKSHHNFTLAMGVLTNVAIGVSVISAFPWIRNRHHKQVLVQRASISPNLIRPAFSSVFIDSLAGLVIFMQQDFWLTFGITVFIITPWLTIRRVKVEVEVPSSKVVILRFERGMQQGLLTRISRGAVTEYHAFGIVSEGADSKEHYLICGVQGDFTRGLAKNPPTHIWTRELKFAGVSNTSTLYKRGIRVCTGTGLGAALSTCLQSPDWYLIWIGSDQEISTCYALGFQKKRLVKLQSPDGNPDSSSGGRPDVMQLIGDAYKSWGAEVVFITSNYQGNKDMMEGCKKAGIPAFGTLWDF